MSTTATDGPARARHLQRVDELCTGTVHALSGDPGVRLRGRLLHRDGRLVPFHAPELFPGADAGFASFRGAADGMALRLLHSDEDLHRRTSPDGAVARAVFEMLEQFRVESLAPAGLPGVVANLRRRHDDWRQEFARSRQAETTRGVLLYSVALICRSRVTGEPLQEQDEDVVESTRMTLAPRIGPDLAALRRLRTDQRAYAESASAIARVVAEIHGAGRDASADGSAGDEPDGDGFSWFAGVDAAGSTGAGAQDDADAAATAGGYSAFTRAHDRVRDVQDVVRDAVLRDLRERLDRLVAAANVNVALLARDLRAVFSRPLDRGWDDDQESGLVDARRLARLVTSAGDHRLFKTERAEPDVSARVTVLVDCSGSMKEHAEQVAVLVDTVGRALELAGVETEVLGFTTGAWNGGRALADWQRAGRPPSPGRVAEVLHVVFKNAEAPWRRGRRGVAGLLRTELYREGVDGEAVDWACVRTAASAADLRHVLVVSDGGPMERATVLANSGDPSDPGDPAGGAGGLLDRHLRDVVLHHQQHTGLAVHGVGLGPDLSRYYDRCLVLDLSGGVTQGRLREVLRTLAAPLPS